MRGQQFCLNKIDLASWMFLHPVTFTNGMLIPFHWKLILDLKRPYLCWPYKRNAPQNLTFCHMNTFTTLLRCVCRLWRTKCQQKKCSCYSARLGLRGKHETAGEVDKYLPLRVNKEQRELSRWLFYPGQAHFRGIKASPLCLCLKRLMLRFYHAWGLTDLFQPLERLCIVGEDVSSYTVRDPC